MAIDYSQYNLEEEETKLAPMPSYTPEVDTFEDLHRGDALKTAIELETFTYQAGAKATEKVTEFFGDGLNENAVDQDWLNTGQYDEEWMTKMEGLGSSGMRYYENLEPQNAYFADVAYKEAKEYQRKVDYLNSLGGEGTAYRVTGALLDLPAVLALTPGSGGTALTTWGARTTQILSSTFARRALAGGTIEGLMELGRREMSAEERDEFNLVLAVGLGSVANGLFGTTVDKELAYQGQKLLKKASEGKDVLREAELLAAKGKQVGGAIDETLQKLQYDLASVSTRAESDAFREVADKLYYQRVGEKAIERGEGKVALEESKDLIEQELYNLVTRKTRPIMTDLAKIAKRGWFKEFQAHLSPDFQRAINETLGDLQLSKLINPESSMDELLEEAASKLQRDLGISHGDAYHAARRMLKATEEISEGSHDILARAGSEMFQTIDDVAPSIPKTKDYMPIVHDSNKMIALARRHSEDEIITFLEKSINAALKKRGVKLDITAKGKTARTRAVATALYKKMTMADDMSFITKLNPATVKNAIEEFKLHEIAGTDADTLANILTQGAKGTDQLGSKFEKTRGIFDYSVKHTTKNGETISFKDIMSNNFEGVWFPYSRTQAGYNTLEKLGLKSHADRLKKVDDIRKELRAKNVDEDVINKEITLFNQTMDELQGKPLIDINPYGRGAQSLRIAKNLNIARYLGGTFWTMSTELGSTVFNTGVVHMFRHVPQMKSLLKQFKTGNLEDDLMQELYTSFGLMGDFNRGVGFSRFEHDFAHVPVMGSDTARMQQFLNSTEKFSDQARELALLAGGIKPLTAVFEGATSSGLLTKMLKSANTGKVSKSFDVTLKEMGIVGDLRKQVFDQIKKHSTYTSSKTFGPKLQKLNIEKWDPEVRYKTIIGVKRMTNTIVQRATLGDKLGVKFGDHLIQNTVVGKLALEMKAYILTSWSKQLGRAVTRRDMYSAGMLATQMALGSVAYMAQTYVNYAHDEKKRKELLTPENIAKVAFSRSAMASWLPQIIDTGAMSQLYDPQFQHARSSGLASNMVTGMPVFDLLNSLGSLPNIPAAALGYGDVTPGELKQASKLMPLYNVIGIRNMMERLHSGYKDHRREQRELDRYRGF